MKRRRRFSGDLKAKVALEALRGDRTLQEIASKHQVHPNQVSPWKRQAIEGLGEVFSNGVDRRRRDHESEVHELHAKIGELTVERDFLVHPVNGEVPPVKGRPWKLPHYANRGKTTSSGGELASARSCFSTVRTALGKLRITGLLAQFDVARSFPQFPRPLLLQPTILTSERGTRFGIRKAPNHVPTSPFTG